MIDLGVSLTKMEIAAVAEIVTIGISQTVDGKF